MVNETALVAELRVRHGVTTLRRLRAAGYTDRIVERLVANGRLERAGNGVLVDAAAADTLEHQVAIACAITGGVVCFPTAGLLWRYRKVPRGSKIHVVVPEQRRPRSRAGIVVHRSNCLPVAHVVRRRDGVSLTSPPRTAFDAAAVVSPSDVESIVEQGIDRNNFTIPTLWAMCRQLVHSARAGSHGFARVLAAREVWQRPARSDYEIRLQRAMLARGFPHLTREHPIEIAPGTVIHPDLGLPDDRFFVEVDHLTWHGGRIESAYDRWRDMQVRLAGAHVERVTDLAIDHHLKQTIEDLWILWQLQRTS